MVILLLTDQVKRGEGFHGVIMFVTVVPLPLRLWFERFEMIQSSVVNFDSKPQQATVDVMWVPGATTKTFNMRKQVKRSSGADAHGII